MRSVCTTLAGSTHFIFSVLWGVHFSKRRKIQIHRKRITAGKVKTWVESRKPSWLTETESDTSAFSNDPSCLIGSGVARAQNILRKCLEAQSKHPETLTLASRSREPFAISAVQPTNRIKTRRGWQREILEIRRGGRPANVIAPRKKRGRTPPLPLAVPLSYHKMQNKFLRFRFAPF